LKVTLEMLRLNPVRLSNLHQNVNTRGTSVKHIALPDSVNGSTAVDATNAVDV
jgi:hypothetical protein